MLKTLIANIDGMVYRCHNDSQWTMEFVSDGCLAVTGYGPEDLLLNHTISYEQLTHPEDRIRVRGSINAALAQGHRFDVEYRILAAAATSAGCGARHRAVYRRRPRHRRGRHRAGHQRARVHISCAARCRAALPQPVRQRHEGIFRTSPDGRYLDANPALARIYGFETPLELMNRLSDIGSQLYVDPSRRQEFIDTITRQRSVSGFESQVRRNRRPADMDFRKRARAVHDDAGRLVCYEGTAEDVTELREYKRAHRATGPTRRPHGSGQSFAAARASAGSGAHVWQG